MERVRAAARSPDDVSFLEEGKTVKTVLVIGATSALGESFLREVGQEGVRFLLISRNGSKLADVVADLKLRVGCEVHEYEADLTVEGDVENALLWLKGFKEISEAVISPGVLSNETKNFEHWVNDLKVNVAAPLYLARSIYELMSKQTNGGALAVVGSVAGDRGRQSNGFYGAQKAAVATYLEALMHKAALDSHKVAIILVKPGQMKSAMTAHLPDSPLFCEPAIVAKKISKVLAKRKSTVIYAPVWWRWMMLMICGIPKFIFFKTKL